MGNCCEGILGGHQQRLSVRKAVVRIKIIEALNIDSSEKVIYRGEVLGAGQTVACRRLKPGGGETLVGSFVTVEKHSLTGIARDAVVVMLAKRGSDLEGFKREGKILQMLDHNNFLKCFATSQQGRISNDWEELERWMMVTEEVKPLGYDLYEYRKNHENMRRHLPKNDILFYTCQLVEAIEHLQLKQIVHRDVKPDNVLITARQVIKIIDFGFASVRDQRGRPLPHIAYQAPESNLDPLNPAIDVYGIGVILYFFAAGRYDDMNAARSEISGLRKDSDVFFVDAMDGLLQIDLAERWTLPQLKEHLALASGPLLLPSDAVMRRWYGRTEPIFGVTLPKSFVPTELMNIKLDTNIAVVLMVEDNDGNQDLNVGARSVLRPGHTVYLGIRTDADKDKVEKGVLSKLELDEVMKAARTQSGKCYYDQLVMAGQDRAVNWTTSYPSFYIFDMPEHCVGETMLELALRPKYRITLAALVRDANNACGNDASKGVGNGILWWPGRDDKVQPGDKGLVMRHFEVGSAGKNTPDVVVKQIEALRDNKPRWPAVELYWL